MHTWVVAAGPAGCTLARARAENLQRESGKDWVLRLATGSDRAADKAAAGAETPR